MPGQTSPQPPNPAEQARQKLARAALLRRQAQELARQRHEVLYRKTPHGWARPPYREQMAAKLLAEHDAKNAEAAQLEQEAEQMLH